jgi:hypothetical protein
MFRKLQRFSKHGKLDDAQIAQLIKMQSPFLRTLNLKLFFLLLWNPMDFVIDVFKLRKAKIYQGLDGPIAKSITTSPIHPKIIIRKGSTHKQCHPSQISN